ncbi:gp689 [Bacillus phage G]|uniref:Gp689 n=1 Tax=Bacillus phage G TaxID=2884420 RepID=G3MB69_9CAUD|nr:gp689 [Bacillus phage G]AEO93932.1 gp689 [Bacillus phage G]
MKDLTDKILQILKEEGIEDRDIRSQLSQVVDNIESRLWMKIPLSLPLLYNLKDTVWYNLEHLPSGGKEKGIDDLRLIGSKYPTFMFYGNDDFYITNDVLKDLLKELEDILKQWSNEWVFVQLFTKSTNGWNGGENNPSPVVIYDPNKGESPSKYGYQPSKSQFKIFSTNGDIIVPEKQEMVLCSLETKLGIYGREPMMKAQLERLIYTCKKCIEGNKGMLIDTENYNYSN